MQEQEAKAIPLVIIDEDSGKYILTKEAETFLRSIQGPIGVVSVAGMYRTGKSYLLNRMLLNRSNGFGVGNTVQACTKGLWCWGQTIKGTTPEGQVVSIIVIDTEGIGALDEDQTHDTRIFTLAILASSCFIYNSTGSIDENAIQNLSLVVNLTKHIQIKAGSDSENQEIDPDEFAQYFPSFFWVVRDFSLQLQTPEGDPISPKQYLQRALAPRNGFSQDIEEKNRIRRLLTSFFKERECFTLIRPLVNETQLQNLDNLPFQDLRPDFVNQVLNFKRRVLGRIKVKTINGKRLNGEMYSSMLSSYVESINNGAVPNIENAWHYMCREQSTHLMEESFQMFEFKMREIKMPINENNFAKESEEAVESSLEHYKQKLVGDEIPQIWKELRQKIKEMVLSFKNENDKMSKTRVNEYMKSIMHPTMSEKVMKMVKDGGSWANCMTEFHNCYDQFLKNGPDVANRRMLYLECSRKIPSSLGERLMNRQLKSIKGLKETQEILERTHADALEKKDKEASERNDKQRDIIKQLDREKIDLTQSRENLQTELAQLKAEKQKEEESLGKNLESKKKELEKTKKRLEDKLNEQTQSNGQLSKKLITNEKEWEKDKAVFEMKLSQLDKQLTDYRKKETLSSTNNEKHVQELADRLNESRLEFDGQLAKLKLQLENTSSEKEEIESKYTDTLEQLRSEIDSLKTSERKHKQTLNDKTREFQAMKTEKEVDNLKLDSEYKAAKEGVQRECRELEEALKKQEQTYKSLNETMRAERASFDREKAKLEQEVSFSEETITQIKESAEEARKDYQRSIEGLENANGQANEEIMDQRVTDLKSRHANELRSLETEAQSARKNMQFQLNDLTKRRDELELEVKIEKSSREAEQQEAESYNEQLKRDSEDAKERCSSLQREKNTRIKQKEAEFERKIRQLENEMDEYKDQQARDCDQRQSQSDEGIIQLKVHFEMEKEKFSIRMAEEKRKHDRTLNELIEEHEAEIRKQVEQLEDQVNGLIYEKACESDHLNELVQKLQNLYEEKMKELKTVSEQLAENKAVSTQKEQDLEEKYTSLLTASKSERQTHEDKVDILQSSLNRCEKEITNLTHEGSTLSMTLKRKETLLEEANSEKAELKYTSENTIDELKNSKVALEQELIENKMTFEKEVTLARHSEENSKAELERLEETVRKSDDYFESKTKAIRDVVEKEIAALKERFTSEKEAISEKYEKLKKSSREAENGSKRQITDMGKDIAVKDERISHLEQRAKDVVGKSQRDYQSLQTELHKLKDSFSTEKKELSREVSQLKTERVALDSENSEIRNSFEKEILLLENKVKHTEKSKEDQKSQHLHSISNLRSTIDSLHRDRLSHKSSSDASYSEKLSQIEHRYRDEIQQKTETSRKEIQDLRVDNGKYELTIKQLSQKLAIKTHEKDYASTSKDRRIEELQDTDRKKNGEIDRLRAEIETRAIEQQKATDSEREHFKTKLNRLEESSRSKQSENNNAALQAAKLQAKYETEKDVMSNQLIELKQKLEKKDRQVGKLKTDYERVKAQKKSQKTHSFLTTNANAKWNNTFIQEKQNSFMTSKLDEENKENFMGLLE